MDATTLQYRKFANANAEDYGSFVCPQCKTFGIVDEDQAKGRVSILCECGFHHTLVLEPAPTVG